MPLSKVVDTPTGSDTSITDIDLSNQWTRDATSATGEDARVESASNADSSGLRALSDFTEGVTGYERLGDAFLRAILNWNAAIDEMMTAYVQAWADVFRGSWSLDRHFAHAIRRLAGASPSSSHHPAVSPHRGQLQATTPAARLREKSGLDGGRLAGIFGVSRTTFQQWIAGSTPRTARQEHLLEVLSLVEEAARQLGGESPTSTWLLSPISPGGQRPMDLLQNRQYDSFRGVLLRSPVERRMVSQPAPFGQRRPITTPLEANEALQRISPRVWGDNDDAGSVADKA